MPNLALTPFPSIVVLIATVSSVAAETDIHKCPLADGTVAFQETPCKGPAGNTNDTNSANESRSDDENPTADDDFFDFVNPFDEPANTPPATELAKQDSLSRDRAECEMTTRNAIDAIDLEMRKKTYTAEQGQQYLAELLALTRQLRDCRAL